MIVDSNGDFVIVGEAVPAKNEAFDILLAKVSPDGNLQWQKFIDGTPNGDAGFDLVESGVEGGYLVVGYGHNPESEQTDIVLGQVDANGEEIETRYLGGNAFDIGYDIIPALEGGFWITGFGFQDGDSQYFVAHEFPIIVNIEESAGPSPPMAIYPNPIRTDQLLQTNITGRGKVEFWDVQGRLLEVKTAISLEEIPLSDVIQEGIYWVKLVVGSEVYWRKIMVH